MVNGISANTNIYALKDLVNLAKYATGVPLTDDAEKLTVSQVASYPATMCTYEGFKWLKNNRGQYKKAFSQVVANGKEANQILKQHGVKGVLRVSDAKEILTRIPEAEALNKLSTASQDLYKNAKTLAEAAKANPSNKDLLAQASKAIATADAAVYAEATKNATGIFSKAKNALGITKLTQASKDLAAKSPTYKRCVDAYNNECGTLMLAIEGGVETFTNVVPTFKELGAKRGFKQLGRSAVKTVASVAGWVGGSALGSKLGDVVGALVGNNKVGAVVSAVAGKVGSYAAGTVGQHFANKGVTKILGKSELEKAKEEQAIMIAQAAQEDPEVFDALVQQAAERLVTEGEDTAESKAVNQTLRNLVAQKTAADENSPMMTREEMKAYADRLGELDGQNVTNPISNNQQGKSGYTGYIPSPEAAPIKPEPKPQPAQQQAQAQAAPQDPDLSELLKRADRVIANGATYLDK